jgi:transcription elongation GreA/GreB family factor
MTFKQKIVLRYKEMLQDRIDVFQDMISGLTIDAQNDAKGSAGDKHETALSMMHLEQEKLNHKLKEILQQKAILDKIDAAQLHKKVALGSLVQANGMLLFISAALPKIILNEKKVFALSPQSPLGSKLMGNEVGVEFDMNGTQYTIYSIE